MKIVHALQALFTYRDDLRPIPTRGTRRRWVVAITAAMAVSVVLTATVSTAFALLAVLVAGPAYLWFARRATRNMTFAPASTVPDGRRRAQVLEAQRQAYSLISAVALIAGLVTVNLVVTFGVDVAPVPFATLAWLAFLAGLYVLPWTPVAILAWRLPDEMPVGRIPAA
jgi:hypothetical protein